MFIPLRTDRPPKRTPLVTQGLIVVNLLVYLAGVCGVYFGLLDRAEVMADLGRFDPQHIRLWQLVTYQFLHDPHGILHIAFNMLFLWVFGAAVEDRLGRLGFLAFYITGGALAAIAHAMVNPQNPIIGASGSIAAVTGAFLALFPRSRIQILIFFFYVGVVSIPSLWFIGFYFAVDLLQQVSGLLGARGGDVAYVAHLAGYVYGFAVGFLLLATKLLKREECDIFFLFTQARRRAAFRAASRGPAPAGMWESASADTGRRLQKHAARRPELTAFDQRQGELRARINRLLAAGDLQAAASGYQELLAQTPAATEDDEGAGRGTVLAERSQLDIATQLYSNGAHADAARAYELLIQSYPGSSKADEVRLILGLLYVRHLHLPQRARELLEKVRPRLRNEAQAGLADQLLSELAT